jgi:glutathione S-transferase
MATSFVLKTIGLIAGLLCVEHFFLRRQAPLAQALYARDAETRLERAYFGVLLLNCVLSSVVLLLLGFRVSRAREECTQMAKLNKDPDAEARFGYPKLYAEGFSAEARKFNCVQRGHQQAFETLSGFLVCSLIGGLGFPVSCALGGCLWSYARWQWFSGYASGVPSNRYSDFFSRGIWSGYLLQIVAALVVCVGKVARL